MTKCPHCIEGRIYAAFYNFSMACRTCEGSGEISDETVERIARGERIQAERLSRKVLLRDEARRLKVGVITLSDIEMGIVENNNWQGKDWNG